MLNKISLFLLYNHKIILAQRGEGQDLEFMLQAPVHGDIVEGETYKQAIARILETETGLAFSELYEFKAWGYNQVGVYEPEVLYYFSAKIFKPSYKRMIPKEGFSRFLLLSKKDLMHDVIIYSQSQGLDRRKQKVMFDDEYEIALKILEKEK